MSIGNKYGSTMMFTLGGLKVDEDTGNVLRHDGTPIVGLYAAGRAAAGLCAIGYFSGVSLSDGVFSGRRAGRDAATRNLQSSVVRNSSSAVPTLATGAVRRQ
jgi:3-oxo-5alpha-steroid 4-dehydrogenase